MLLAPIRRKILGNWFSRPRCHTASLQEIQEIFGDEQKGPDGQEKRITYSEYLRRVNARLTKIRNAKKEVTKVNLGRRV